VTRDDEFRAAARGKMMDERALSLFLQVTARVIALSRRLRFIWPLVQFQVA
jgi:hypothetical protein